MRWSFRSLCLAGALILVCPAAAGAQETIWFSPLDLHVDANSPFTLETVGSSSFVALRAQTTQLGVSGWVRLSLPLPSTAVIDSIFVCYQSPDAGNHPTGIRLNAMTVPNTASTLCIASFPPSPPLTDCHAFDVSDASVAGAVTFSLQLFVGSYTNPWIDIGAVGVKLASARSAVGEMPSPPARLLQAHPNPSPRGSTIEYDLARAGRVELRVFDAQGRSVRMLVDEMQPEGRRSLLWDGSDDEGRALPSGCYFYQLIVDGSAEAKRMILVR